MCLQAEEPGPGPAGGRDTKGTAAAASPLPPTPPTAPTRPAVAAQDGATSGARLQYAAQAGARGDSGSHASDAVAVSDPNFYAPRLCFLVLLVYMIVFHGPHL